jgi:hypothetical protein
MKMQNFYLLFPAVAFTCLGILLSSFYWSGETARWKHAYEAELEIRSNLDELLKEFRSVCAER